MRLSLRVSKLKSGAWRWFYEDMDDPVPVLGESGDFPSWKAAEADARATHPTVERVWIHAVRGYGTAFEDSL